MFAKTFFKLACLCLIGASIVPADNDTHGELPTLAATQTLFDEATAAVRSRHQDQRDLLLLQYANELNTVRREAQEAGDLDGVLLVQREQARVRDGEPFGDLDMGAAPDGFRTARRRVRERLDELAGEEQSQLQQLQTQYVSFLQRLEREHTMQNNIAKALAFREERQRVETGLQAGPAMPEDTPEDETAPQVVLNWNRGMAGRGAEFRRGDEVKTIEFEHQGDNRVGARGLALRGGATHVRGLGEVLSETFKTSNQFTLVATLESDRVPQSGPARIVSFTRDHSAGNFSLGQQNDQLVLRLRTSHHGGYGGPNLSLGPIRAGRATRVVITHEPGNTRLFRDGEEIDLSNRAGDFSNWEAFGLVLGNEHTGERPWHGTLTSFTLANQSLPPETALRLSREL